jgi:hypothetical protein
MYPKNFFFAVVRDGIDGRRSLLNEGPFRHRRRSSTTTKKDAIRKSSLMESGKYGDDKNGQDLSKPISPNSSALGESASAEDNEETHDVEMDELAGAMSALRFIPPSVRFGRGGRAGFSRR